MNKEPYLLLLPAIYPNSSSTQLGVYVYEQCRALKAKYGYKIIVLNGSTARINRWNQCGILREYEDDVGIVFERFTKGFLQSKLPLYAIHSYQKNIKELFQIAVKKYGVPEIIYAHFSFPSGYVAMQISRDYNIPCVVEEHYSLYLKKRINPLISYVTRQTVRRVDSFICVSEKLKNAVYNHTRLKKFITVIPNMVSSQFVYHPPINKKNFVFFSGGNLFSNKKFDILIEAFVKAFDKNDCVSLYIAGDGPEKEKLQKLIDMYDRNRQIILLGRLPLSEMLHYYINCDCFALFSEYETFGIVYREALAVGRPVISTRNGGIEEGWDPQFGLLLDENTVECGANALIYLKNHIHLYDPLTISKKCLEKYSESVVVEKINTVLMNALSAHASIGA